MLNGFRRLRSPSSWEIREADSSQLLCRDLLRFSVSQRGGVPDRPQPDKLGVFMPRRRGPSHGRDPSTTQKHPNGSPVQCCTGNIHWVTDSLSDVSIPDVRRIEATEKCLDWDGIISVKEYRVGLKDFKVSKGYCLLKPHHRHRLRKSPLFLPRPPICLVLERLLFL